MGEAFSFSPLSIPFIVVALGLLVLALTAVLVRGNGLIRASLLAVALTSLPWAVCSALNVSCDDPEIVLRLSRFYVGTVALVGPALLLLLLAYSGRLEHHRVLLAVATVIASASCVLCWTTDLCLIEPWKTPWGIWFAQAGPLNDLLPGNLVVWSLVGVVLARRGRNAGTRKAQRHTRRLVIILILAALGASDALLAHGIGVYPFSIVSGVVAVGMALYGVLWLDMLNARGIDRAAAIELALVVVFAAVIALVVWLLFRAGVRGPLEVAVALAPLFALTQLAIVGLRRWTRRDVAHVASEADLALEAHVELSSMVRDVKTLARSLTELLEGHAAFEGVRLYRYEGDALVPVPDPTDAVAVDARIRPWLVANRAVLIADELHVQRLGGLREPIHAFLGELDAEVVFPLIDREQLVGAIAAAWSEHRALRDHELLLLEKAGLATAKALTYIRLFREAEARMEVAKEVEVAAAVQHARAPGEARARYPGVEVISHYQPAAQFGGDWWTSCELADGRIFVAIGDVTGHGVPAALVSSTVAGACETAQLELGGGFDVLTLLQLLNASVRDVGGEHYAMTCFAAVFDTDAGRVTFANAGHPFPYVCRSGASGETELSSLVSRGTPLGAEKPILSAGTAEVQPGDVVVFYSDALVDSRSPEGKPYGDRRLQRILRRYVIDAGPRAAEVIIEDALGHYDDQPILDDVTLVVVRLGGAAEDGKMAS